MLSMNEFVTICGFGATAAVCAVFARRLVYARVPHKFRANIRTDFAVAMSPFVARVTLSPLPPFRGDVVALLYVSVLLAFYVVAINAFRQERLPKRL